MVSTKKVIAALGIVAGLGVVALPLGSYAATEQNITVSANIGATLSMSTPTTPNVALNPVNNGAIDEGSSSVNITTNNGAGYTLSIKDSDTNTALVHSTDGSQSIAAGVPAQGTSAWGYKVGSGSYAAVTTSDVAIRTTSTPTAVAGDDVAITFGVSASSSQASGTYAGGVTLTVAAN